MVSHLEVQQDVTNVPQHSQIIQGESGFQGARPGTGNERSTNSLFMKVIISKWLAKVLKSD